MTLEELQAEINELKESSKWHTMQIGILDAQICAMQKQQPEQPKLERWKPEHGKPYWYITGGPEFGFEVFEEDTWSNEHPGDKALFESFNCFQTKEEAQQEALRTRARRKLEWYARELNGQIPYEEKTIINRKVFYWSMLIDGGIGEQHIQFLPTGSVWFFRREHLEYALSQMTAEELEALRTFADVDTSFISEMPDEELEALR